MSAWIGNFCFNIIQLIMASLNKRKQLVNELRKAHFPFGFENTPGAESEYVRRYKEHQVNGAVAPSNNARANNFSVTDPSGNMEYTSEFKHKYPEQPIVARGDPSALKKMHADKNFVFGYDGSNYGTNYNDDYLKKNSGHQGPAKPINQKEPHICLGDSLTDFTTTYNKIHDAKEASRPEPKDPQLIRKSNMILGNDASNFQTQSNATYVQKPITNYHITKKSNTSNISLGADFNGYSSENKGNFYHKEVQANPVDKNQVQDFKKAHFQLGFPTAAHGYDSEAIAQYGEKPLNYQRAVGNRDSQFDLNLDGKNYFDSTYGNQFTGKNGERSQPVKNIGQIDNVMMGADNDPNLYVSEAKDQFGKKNGQLEQTKGKKHPTCLDIGKGEGDYLTHNQDTYKDRFGQHSNSRLTNEEIQKLKGLNFTTGFQGPDYNLSSALYGRGSCNPNKLPQQTLNAMKNTNIVQGDDDPYKGNTTYKTSFHWKQGEE